MLSYEDFVYFMTYDEFQRHIGKAGLKLNQFADLVKMNHASISNMKRCATVPTHLAIIATLLGEMAEREIDFRSILGEIEISYKRPRGAGVGKFGGNKQNNLDIFNKGQPNG